jgi:hypothetical protein
MKTEKIRVEGKNINELPIKLIERWKPGYQYQDGNFFILMNEQHYFRIESNLLSVLIVKIVGEDVCEIEVVIGGGANQMGNDWGAEDKENQNIIRELVQMSVANSWRIIGNDSTFAAQIE